MELNEKERNHITDGEIKESKTKTENSDDQESSKAPIDVNSSSPSDADQNESGKGTAKTSKELTSTPEKIERNENQKDEFAPSEADKQTENSTQLTDKPITNPSASPATSKDDKTQKDIQEEAQRVETAIDQKNSISSEIQSENKNDEDSSEITFKETEKSDDQVTEVGNEIGSDERKDDEDQEKSKGQDEHEDSDNNTEEDEEEHQLDYSNYSKKQMVQVLESLLKEDDFSQVGKILKEIRKPYDDLTDAEQKQAYERYIEDGGEKDGFEYRPDELDQRFEKAYGKLKDRRNQYFNSLEKQKEQNLNLKLEILEKLRELVDSEETGASIKDLKELQKEWKEVGVIPSSQVKSLWANYNALLDRFYDQRSIYFELKELDRKKNYDLKIELCKKAEELSENNNIQEVIKHLNELHEEFKHIGPVPKEDQDAVWERFKTASDKIYAKRKAYFDKLKEEFKLNEVAKLALVEKVAPFAAFNSDRISDWNAKTKEIIAIQKEWEAIGSLPKEHAKNVNKQFWSSFKAFFNLKGQFFKKLEGERKENLKLKQELVEKAEALKDSEDFRKTSDEMKRMQKKWKEIGPVPEKYRNEVFIKFKKACDHFFDRRRANSGKIEKEYEENLEKKKVLCEELEKMIGSDEANLDRIRSIEEEWSQIGFVPKANIRSIQKRYTEAISKITEKVDISESERHKLRFSAQFHTTNYGPGSEKMIQRKEGSLRRQISTLENDVNLWKNNIDFFAASKNADKLKKEFQVKIDKANAQLKSLKEQLKIISNI